jgi:hypothetical protein
MSQKEMPFDLRFYSHSRKMRVDKDLCLGIGETLKLRPWSLPVRRRMFALYSGMGSNRLTIQPDSA